MSFSWHARGPQQPARQDGPKGVQKLDKDGSGRITLSDLKGTFNASHHPKVISGEIKEADALQPSSIA